ncbi:MAG: metal-sensing transcriptional repressor [Bacillota bacterium]
MKEDHKKYPTQILASKSKESSYSSNPKESIKIQNDNTSIISQLNNIEDQIKIIKRMIEKDVYCYDVLIHIIATQSAIKSVSNLIFEDHLKSCLIKKIKSGEPDVVEELIITMEKLMK